MKSLSLVLLCVCAAVASHSSVEATTFKEKVLCSFCAQRHCKDGAYPSDLINVNGTYYGLTWGGGHKGCHHFGCGTAFSLDPNTGVERVLYSFCSENNGVDGASPTAGVIDFNGTLYGTTHDGGAGFFGEEYGTAFSLDPTTGAEKVLYSFCSQQNCPDGANPTSLIVSNGVLYGTTDIGGAGFHGQWGGTAFALDQVSGTEAVLHTFCKQQNCTDGAAPNPALVDVNGTLYGVTVSGGANACGNGNGCGTLFSLDPASGAYSVLHSFGSGTDGRVPEAGLISANGTLYGTTYGGPVPGCGSFGCGTVFSFDSTTGAEKVLYFFCSQQNCTDGANPLAGLTSVNGFLYGTTSAGGGTGCGGSGCGTVFSVDPNTGAETVLYSFCRRANCADGANPTLNLIAAKGQFYGTTESGGAHGRGTAFVLKEAR